MLVTRRFSTRLSPSSSQKKRRACSISSTRSPVSIRPATSRIGTDVSVCSRKSMPVEVMIKR